MFRIQPKISLIAAAIVSVCSLPAEAHVEPWMELLRQGKRALSASDYPRAVQLYQQALDCTPKSPEYGVDRLIINHDMISALISCNSFSQAERLALDNLKLANSTTGPISTEVYSTYGSLGRLYKTRNKPGDNLLSASYFRKALVVSKRLYGTKNERIIVDMRVLQMAEALAEHHDESISLAFDLLHRIKELPPFSRKSYFDIAVSAGESLPANDKRTLDLNMAIMELLDAEGATKKEKHAVDHKIAVCLGSLPASPAAETAAQGVLARLQANDTSREGLRTLFHLADFYAKNRRWTDAEKLYQRALLLSSRRPEEEEYAMILLHFASYFLTQRKEYKAAQPYYQRASTWFEEHEENLYLSQTLSVWASSLTAEKKYEEAYGVCKRAVEASTRVWGAKKYTAEYQQQLAKLEAKLQKAPEKSE